MEGHRNVSGLMGSSQMQTPSHRQPFTNVTGNSVNRSSVSGYGMSAGLKVGRQQGNRNSTKFVLYYSTPLTSNKLLVREVSLTPAKAVTEVASWAIHLSHNGSNRTGVLTTDSHATDRIAHMLGKQGMVCRNCICALIFI